MDDLHDPEVEHLDEIVLAAVSAHQDVRGFDVAVHQPVGLGFSERVTDLTKQKDRPFGGHRAVPPDECIEVEAVEQLHHVIETAVAGDAEIPELHGVRRAQPGRDLRFALEGQMVTKYPVLEGRPVVIELTYDEVPPKAIVDSWSRSAKLAMRRGVRLSTRKLGDQSFWSS